MKKIIFSGIVILCYLGFVGLVFTYAPLPILRNFLLVIFTIILALILPVIYMGGEKAKEETGGAGDEPDEKKKSPLSFSLGRFASWAFVLAIIGWIALTFYGQIKTIQTAEKDADTRRANVDNVRMQPLPIEYTQFGKEGTLTCQGDLIQNDLQAMKFVLKYKYDAAWYQTDFSGKPAGYGPDGKANLFKGEFTTERPRKTGTWTLHKHPQIPFTWVGTTMDSEEGPVNIQVRLL